MKCFGKWPVMINNRTREGIQKHTFSTNLSSWLLAVPGSPSSSTLMSPLSLIPSGSCFRDPPNNKQVIAFFMSAQQQQGKTYQRQPRQGTEKSNHRCFRRYWEPRSLQTFHKSFRFEPSHQTPPLPQERTVDRRGLIPFRQRMVLISQGARS